MADEKNLILNANQDLGEIVIAPEVIEVIIGIAASKVEAYTECAELLPAMSLNY